MAARGASVVRGRWNAQDWSRIPLARTGGTWQFSMRASRAVPVVSLQAVLSHGRCRAAAHRHRSARVRARAARPARDQSCVSRVKRKTDSHSARLSREIGVQISLSLWYLALESLYGYSLYAAVYFSHCCAAGVHHLSRFTRITHQSRCAYEFTPKICPLHGLPV